MDRLLVRAIFLLAVTAAAVFCVFRPGFPQARLADPLLESERALAEQVVLTDQELGRLLAQKRFRLLKISPAEVSRASLPRAPSARQAMVIIYNYTDDVTVLSLADLHARAVVSVEERRLQPSLHPEEREEALGLAQRDGRVWPVLEGRQILAEGLLIADRTPGAPCFHSRCVELQFVVDGQPSSLVVVVNLSAETVVRVRGGH